MGLFDFINGNTKARTAPAELIKHRDATIPELEEQLAEARRAGEDAARAVAAAQGAFDDSGAPAAAQALAAAQATAQTAQAYIDRAERLLGQAKDAAAAAERARLEAERARLEAELEHGALAAARAPLVRAEVAAIIAVAEARKRRRDLEVEIGKKRSALYRVMRQLGEEPPAPPFYGFEPAVQPVSEAVLEHATALENAARVRAGDTDPRVAYLHQLVR